MDTKREMVLLLWGQLEQLETGSIQGLRGHSSGNLNTSFYRELVHLMFPLFCSKPKDRDDQDRERVEEPQGCLSRLPHGQRGLLCKNSPETLILE